MLASEGLILHFSMEFLGGHNDSQDVVDLRVDDGQDVNYVLNFKAILALCTKIGIIL